MLKTRRILIILLLLSAVSIIILLWSNREKFTTPYNHTKMGWIYSESQYVKGPKATVTIGDDGLFAVAGYYLFLQGGDPSQIHFEGPPLGEYLIGISILLFRNEFIISIIYGILLLVLTYELGFLLFRNQMIGVLAIFFISFDQLFLRHLHSSLLDLPQSLFVTAAIYFYIKGLNKINNFWFSSFFFGLAFATKFFPGILIIITVFIYWCWREKSEKLFYYIHSLALVPLIYLVSYIKFFYYHPSLIEFFNFQKWVLVWRMGNPRVLGNILLTLITGRYRSWWQPESWIVDNEWSLITPFIFITAILSMLLVNRKKYPSFIYLYSTCILFLIYLAIGTTGVAKYIYPIYPLISIFAAYSSVNILRKFGKQ